MLKQKNSTLSSLIQIEDSNFYSDFDLKNYIHLKKLKLIN